MCADELPCLSRLYVLAAKLTNRGSSPVALGEAPACARLGRAQLPPQIRQAHLAGNRSLYMAHFLHHRGAIKLACRRIGLALKLIYSYLGRNLDIDKAHLHGLLA